MLGLRLHSLASRTAPSANFGQPVLWLGALLAGCGAIASFFIALTADGGPYWSDGATLTTYMLAGAGLAGLLGLIFAIPRWRTDAVVESPTRYSSNSNLEQISDWLTKLLVGAGLVQLAALPRGLRALGDYLAGGLQIPNAAAVSVTITLYGIGLGFLIVYLWARLRLRVVLETIERQADEQAEREVQVAASVAASIATAKSPAGQPETPASITQAAARAAAAVMQRDPARLRAVLWVDDHPENNVSEREAFESLGIEVRIEMSTDDALRTFRADRYGVVISDFGRRENDEDHPEAGRELIEALRATGARTPIVIYGGPRAVANRDALLAAGATLVASRTTELIRFVVDALTS